MGYLKRQRIRAGDKALSPSRYWFFPEELCESGEVAMALQFPAQKIPREVKHSPVVPFTCTTTGSISEVRRTEQLPPLANTTEMSTSVTLSQTAGVRLGTITRICYSQVF